MGEKVLITGARAIAALDIARDFKRLGFEVHMADSAGGAGARFSRAVDVSHRYTAPRRDFSGFGCDVTRLIEAVRPKLIIPTCEEIFHLARLPVHHCVHQTLFAPPLRVLRQLHDKASFAALCASLNLPVPETHVLAAPAHVARFVDTASQWVFKPCFSRFGSETMVAPRPEDLSKLTPTQDTKWVAQARVRGEEICFHAISHMGKLTAFVAYRGTWRLRSGASLGFEALTQTASRKIMDIAARLASALGLTGQFGCDLIIDGMGQPWLIECNPRATSGVHLWPQEGRLAKAFLNTNSSLLIGESAKPLYLSAAMATLALGDAVGSGRFLEWCTVMGRGRDVIGLAGDRLPVVGALIDGITFMAKGALRGVPATAATTLDIEWNGEVNDQPIA